jgi:hypothetical protein
MSPWAVSTKRTFGAQLVGNIESSQADLSGLFIGGMLVSNQFGGIE